MPKPRVSGIIAALNQSRRIFPPLKKLLFEIFWFVFALAEIVPLFSGLCISSCFWGRIKTTASLYLFTFRTAVAPTRLRLRGLFLTQICGRCLTMKLPVIELMPLSRIAAPFDNPDFVFELKHDGFRSLAYIADGRCSLVSRRTHYYHRFISLKTALAKLKVENAILDGEIVCLDSDGKSRLNLLLRRGAEPVFYAFDLLWLNGKDLRKLPLVERKIRLRKLIEKSDCERIIYVQHIEMRGCVLYRAICKKDLGGIVAKRRDSVYSVSGHWLKVLNPNYTHQGHCAPQTKGAK